MDLGARIYIAGHTGLVGSALVRRLRAAGYQDLILRTRSEADLTKPAEVESLFAEEKPEYVLLAAGRVGGILANARYPGDFIRENLAIQLNVLEAGRRHAVTKLLFLGSSCIYPRDASQPIRETDLMTGPLEPTNRAYAIAKIAGIEMCQAYSRQYGCRFISLMPTNLYGPGDDFDLERSHVLAALLRRFHEAKQEGTAHVTVWGTGAPRREFMHVDDLADACLVAMKAYDSPEILNVGVGEDVSIRELAEMIRDVVGYEGQIRYDPSKPDGTPRKTLDVSRLEAMGWRARVRLRDGVASTYRWFLEHGPGEDARTHARPDPGLPSRVGGR